MADLSGMDALRGGDGARGALPQDPLWAAAHLPHKGGETRGYDRQSLSPLGIEGTASCRLCLEEPSGRGQVSPPLWGRWPAGQRGSVFPRAMRAFILALFLALSTAPAFAVNPDEVLADPVLEGRARGLSAQLRCMVCQNQSIDDSNAELAKDLRRLVRERLQKGESDEAVIDYVVSRYGEFVLLKPRVEGKTLILWAAPAVLLLAGGTALFLAARRRGGTATRGTPLSPEEQEALARLLERQPAADAAPGIAPER